MTSSATSSDSHHFHPHRTILEETPPIKMLLTCPLPSFLHASPPLPLILNTCHSAVSWLLNCGHGTKPGDRVDGGKRRRGGIQKMERSRGSLLSPTRTVKKWSEEAEEALKDCFNTTLWDVFSDAHGEDIDSLTHCLTDYINFCVENTVPTRTVRSFSNSKPWITPDIKALLKEKRRAFVSGNKEELKSVQRELRRMIRKGKDCYRRKMEHQLQQNNICGVWKGLKTISGFKEPKSQPVGDQGWANDLNLFFNRFDQASAPPLAQSPLLQPPSQSVPPVHCSSPPPVPPHPLSRPSVHTYLPPSHDPQFTPTLSSHLPGHFHFHTLSCAPPPHQHLPAPACSSQHTR
ncbi:hypothetical protein L3Q82_000110 [Scortum barcoo]|uniref:Uncharacterized protein n=1 Tax=Scortum barcoo TaxID=214431 RepID=A0ACB8X991_9TELE|nr:hypothetical protein L3Q82_000110 [Scortum barcoo]